MPFFSVTPEELSAGSAVVGSSAGGATGGLSGVGSAAAMTPVEAAWGAFIDRAGAATKAMDEVTLDLAQALSAAAGAYARSDSTAAMGFSVKP